MRQRKIDVKEMYKYGTNVIRMEQNLKILKEMNMCMFSLHIVPTAAPDPLVLQVFWSLSVTAATGGKLAVPG